MARPAPDELAVAAEFAQTAPPEALAEIFGPGAIEGETEATDEPVSADDDSLIGAPDGRITLNEDRRLELVSCLLEILQAHDAAMTSRWDREDEIERAYAMIPDANRGGIVPDAARMVSSITQAFVDQAAARISRGIMEVKPLMKVDPIIDAGFQGEMAVEMAKKAERFFESYVMDELDFNTMLPIATKRATKLGSAVFRAMWTKTRCAYYENGKREIEEKGYLDVQLPENHNIVCWPLNIYDAQCATIFGHRNHLTPGEFKNVAAQLNVDADTVAQILNSDSPDRRAQETLKNQDIKPSQTGEYTAHITLTELWCNLALPGELEPSKYMVVLHEESRNILYLGYNRLKSQKHPYYPLHYQRVDGSFWGKGVGHEAMFAHAADSTFRNLEIDNLRATAAWVQIVKSGSMAESMADRISPGFRVVTDSPDEDIQFKELGGDLSNIYQAKNANYQDAIQVTGLASVLMGLGDPNMKSGASATATVSLIEQAGKKFGDVDATFRDGLEDLYIHLMETVAQFAPDGLYYKYLDPDSAGQLRMIRFVPPEGDITRMFHIRAQAPSAAMNRESYKERLLALYQLTTAHVNLYMGLAMGALQQQNPAEIPRLQYQVCKLLEDLYKQIIEAHQVPGVINDAPSIGQPMPADQVINQLMQQTQKMGQQLQGLAQQNQQLQHQMQMQQPPSPQGMPMPPGPHAQGVQ